MEWNSKRKELNILHRDLQNKPEREKLGYQLSLGGILNAYRWGDISFGEACELLQVKEKPILKEYRKEYEEGDEIDCPRCGSDDLDISETPSTAKCNKCGLTFHTRIVVIWKEQSNPKEVR